MKIFYIYNIKIYRLSQYIYKNYIYIVLSSPYFREIIYIFYIDYRFQKFYSVTFSILENNIYIYNDKSIKKVLVLVWIFLRIKNKFVWIKTKHNGTKNIRPTETTETQLHRKTNLPSTSPSETHFPKVQKQWKYKSKWR